ncbi:MAG: caspase family protein [Cyclobacteriaceae bacterium]|nr:caspase family protein [Cyclobacteriaceae bacterium]
MKPVRFFIFLVTLLSSMVATAQYKLYEKGLNSYQHAKYKEAIVSFSEYLSKSIRDKSLDVEVYYLRGLSYYKSNDYKNSIGDFEEAILLNHANKSNIYWFLAKSHDQLGYFPDAIQNYTRAIEGLKSDREKYVVLLYERSQVYVKLKDATMAYTDLQAAYEIQPGNEAVKQGLVQLDKIGYSKASPVAVQTRSIAQDSTVNKALAELYKNEKRYALVIGNSAYSKSIGELRNPVNDAIDMAAELEKSNFEVQLLTNATYGQMRAELLKFKEKLDEGERDQTVALFYFAGHGLRQEDENYLVPVDALVEFEDDVRRYCFPVQRMVLANMERSKTRLNIVILDACRNNPFPSLTRSIGEQGLGELAKARGSFVAYATAPGSVAEDGLGRNGLYTQELLHSMRKRGLTLDQVFKEVRLNVLRLSGEKQKTWDNSNITGEFYFKY